MRYVQQGTILFGPAHCTGALFRTARCNALQCNLEQYTTVYCATIQFRLAQCSAVQCSALPGRYTPQSKQCVGNRGESHVNTGHHRLLRVTMFFTLYLVLT